MPGSARTDTMAIAVSRFERAAQAAVRGVSRVGWLRALVLSPIVARPGYWFATLCGLLWGTVLSFGRIRSQGGVIVARNCPRWSFGRGGTTIGAVFLTNNALSPGILAHEAVHRAQWKRYGLALIPLYIAAGRTGVTNRFEIEAGLKRGGYIT